MSELENSQSRTEVTARSLRSCLPATAASRKSQYVLGFTIDALVKRVGVAHVLFVTLTFKKRVRSTEIAHGKLNSLLNAVRKRSGAYLWVLEPHQSGCVHYHLLIPVDFNCHAGTDVEAWWEKFFPLENMYFRSENPARCGESTRETYLCNSMSPALRAEADWWILNAEPHGFGKVRVEPVYGTAEQMRKYMVKQNWRNGGWPFEEKKNVRLWDCSRKLKTANANFSWNSPGAQKGRQRKAQWANEHGCESINDLRCVMGVRWGYIYLCEEVWGRPPKGVVEVQTTCPFPRRRYNDPDFQPHPGLYESSRNDIVAISAPP